jgi:kynurenine formamidase
VRSAAIFVRGDLLHAVSHRSIGLVELMTCLPWLHERKIAVLGSDGISHVVPGGYAEIALPIHTCVLVMMGLHLIDNADLDVLAETCARNSRYAFQFIMAPLVLKQGTASPVNPLALF